MEVEGIPVQFMRDPGAEVKQKMALKNKFVTEYGHSTRSLWRFKLKPPCIIMLNCKHTNETVMLEFMLVVGNRSLIVLSTKDCEKLGLIKRVHSAKEQHICQKLQSRF